jgi:ligand-binding SRPBCC domain-containing protein
MPVILLTTEIEAPIETCFDLARSIDLHQLSTAHTNERAIAGRTSGLIELDEFVTWEAVHFGLKQQLSSRITAMERPFHFRDEQIRGAFKYIVHDHYFEQQGSRVVMKDIFRFRSPLGPLGWLADRLVLTAYLKKLLTDRNAVIREHAEKSL